MSSELDARRVAVVVPNWNGAAFLGRTLQALRVQTRPADEVLVVDNGSADDSLALVANDFPEVRVIALPHNTGFAGAANAGLRATTADLVAMLNNDARPRADWLECLLAQPDDPDVWAWGSVLTADRATVESAGDHYDPTGYAYKLARGTSVLDLPSDPYPVFAPPGASPLLRRDVVLSLGAYAERFFLYYEDVDLAFRALLAGYRAVMVPAAVVEHDLGRSSAGSARPWFYIGRNSLWCAVRCLPRVRARALWRRTRREWGVARHRGGGRAYVLGRAAGVLGLPWAVATRRRIQADRLATVTEVMSVLENPPSFRIGVSR